MGHISAERMIFAFGQLKTEHGPAFERFANAFVMKELPKLRPVGGVHDGARDAYIYKVDGTETSFLQSSVTEFWPRKIRETVAALEKNGNSVKELIYCTNRPILADADSLRAELRARAVFLDIRDRNYFVAKSNSTPEHSDLCEAFAVTIVDPLLAAKRVADPSKIILSDEDERLALAYLDLLLKDKSKDMALTRFCFESMVRYALRGASEANPKPLQEIVDSVRRAVPSHEDARVAVLVELLSNVVDGKFLGGGLLGFDSVDKRNSLNHVG